MKKTIIFGGSGFFGPIILKKYPKIISVGRSKPPKNIKNKHIALKNLNNLRKLDKINFDKVIFLIGSFYVVTHDLGLARLIEIKQEKTRLETSIHQLTRQQIKLNNEITNLKTNKEYIEQIAREKFMMAKPGEKVFKVVQYKIVDE